MADDKKGDLNSIYQDIVNQQTTTQQTDFGTKFVIGTKIVLDHKTVLDTESVDRAEIPHILNEDDGE